LGVDRLHPHAHKANRKILLRLKNFRIGLLAIIEAVDPETAPITLIDAINNAMRQPPIWNELTAFASNGEAGHLTNANNNLSGHLQTLAQLQGIVQNESAPKPPKSLEKQFDQFVKAVGNQHDTLTSLLKNLETSSENLGVKLKEISTSADQKRTEIDQLASGWQSQFSDAQDARLKVFEEWKKETTKEFKERADQLIEEGETSLKTKNQSFATEIDRLIEESRAKHKDILDLHGIVAGDSVAAGYLQNADSEKSQANFWRWASIIFIVATAAWTIFAYIKAPAVTTGGLAYWGQALKALSVAGVLLFGAVYSSKQSNLHRRNEQKTRWLALEVKAIDPFIASLSSEEQKELKKSLSEKLFGQMNNIDSTNEDAINEHVFQTVMKSVTDVIKASRS